MSDRNAKQFSQKNQAWITPHVKQLFVLLLFALFTFSVVAGSTVMFSPNIVNAQVTQQQFSIAQLYQNVRDSVVVIMDLQPQSTLFGQAYGLVEGSGFIYNLNGSMVIITNYHVVNQGINISVTFRNGNGYAASVVGSDPYADLAVLTSNAPANEYKPLQIASSSSLSVGDFVAAIGSPFGLSGSMTTGIVSQLGRTITEAAAGNYPIANVIQTDAPINPGNSGGPLLNNESQVVGINTATVSGSTGVGFAIPSNTILREIDSLVSTGTYTLHPYLGIGGVDMSYNIASQTGLSVTYGVLIQQVTSGGPADNAGIKAGTAQATIDGSIIIVGGDVITAINGTRTVNTDDLSSYLEQNTLPGHTITITILRNNQTQDVSVVLGTRPPPNETTSPSPTPTPVLSSPTTSPSPVLSFSSSPTISEITSLAVIILIVVGTSTIVMRIKLRARYSKIPFELERKHSA